MPTLLHVKSSILGEASQSDALCQHYIERWQTANPGAQVVVRDLVAQPLDHLTAAEPGAWMTDPAARTAEQQALVAQSDALIEEVRQADSILLGLPMYNFGVPSQLKAWFDRLARAGVTFRYTESGPEGLLADRPVLIVAARGGRYHTTGQDYQMPYVKQFFGFLGLRSVRAIYAEGLNLGDAARQEALGAARAELDTLFAQ
jgi:FMN-dependent NADH-azoreductase